MVKIFRSIKNYSNMDIICHRGASSLYPENTIYAIKSCIDLGCNCSEIDIQLTKDNRIIALHDDTLKRTAIGLMPNINQNKKLFKKIVNAPINKLYYRDIEKINLGNEYIPQKAPLLEDILKMISNYIYTL